MAVIGEFRGFPWVFCFPKSRVNENGGDQDALRPTCFSDSKIKIIVN